MSNGVSGQDLKDSIGVSGQDLIDAAEARNPYVDFAQQFVGRGLDALEFIGGPSFAVEKTDDGWQPAQPGGFREQAGIPERSDTMTGRAAEFAFDAAVAATPIGRFAQTVRAVPPAAGRLRTMVQGAVRQVGERFRGAPLKTTAQEAALGSSAGAVGYMAEEKFPDSDAARLIGEIAGGAGPGIATDVTLKGGKVVGKGLLTVGEASPVLGRVVTWAREGGESIIRTARERARTPLTARVSRRVDRATDDRAGVLVAMDEDLARRELLTPAQQAGDPGLLSLEKSVIDSSDRLRIHSDEQLAALNEALKQDIVLPGSVADTQVTFEQELQYFSDLTYQRIRSAALLADERISRMLPQQGREAANRVARAEIDDAFTAASKHEDKLFDKIDQDAVVTISASQSAVENAAREMGRARHRDVPSYAIRVFHPKGKGYTPITDVRELRGTQSRLRETSRTARAEGRFNRARIADDIADAITKDISRIEGVGDEVRMAVGYSRYKNEVFRQGNVGKILGYVDTGEGRIPAGLTLEATLGAGGTGRGREAFDDIIRAAGISPEVRVAMDDFIREDFIASTVSGGAFDRGKAETYLTTNRETLNRVPHLRDEMQAAVDANNAQAFTQGVQKRLNPSVGRATMFIEQGPQKAFDDIINSRNSRAEMHKLMNMTDRDDTGRATQGLKTAFSQYILGGAVDNHGVLSGEKLAQFIADPKSRGAMEALFSKEEMLSMTRIIRTAQRMDLARTAHRSAEGITGEKLDEFTSGVARFVGAMYGRSLGTGTIQVPQLFANKAEAIARAGITNPSRELLIASVQDPKLFRAMLESEASDDIIRERANARLNAWLAGLLTTDEQDQEMLGTDMSRFSEGGGQSDAQPEMRETIFIGTDAVKEAKKVYGDRITPEMESLIIDEGFSTQPYRDTKGNVTVGVGQTDTFANMSFPDVYKIKAEQAASTINNWEDVPSNVKEAIISSNYRGDWLRSVKTINLFNQGRYEEAANEFLNNADYRQAKRDKTGIAARFERTADAIRSMSKK